MELNIPVSIDFTRTISSALACFSDFILQKVSSACAIEYFRDFVTQLLLNLLQLDKQMHFTKIFNNGGVSGHNDISSESSAKFSSYNFKF